MSNRIEKVNSLMEHEVGKIIRRDFTFSPEILVTLTRIETSGNMIVLLNWLTKLEMK